MSRSVSSLSMGMTLSALLLSSGLASADNFRIRGGGLACGGNHFSRIAETEQHRTTYVLRNFSKNATVMIERIQLFDANGNTLFDFPEANPLPESVKTELGPHETTQINTVDIVSKELKASERPIQAHVKWSYEWKQKGVALHGSTVRTVRDRDNGIERSRASSECKLVDIWR